MFGPSPDPIRVLVVDDDPVVSAVLARHLEDEGYTIAGMASDGGEAVEKTQRLRPDVVVMDLELPTLDGSEASRAIGEKCPTPIVVVTGHDDANSLARATNAGVGAFVMKPLRAAELTRGITIARARFADQQALRRINDELATQVRLYQEQVDLNRRVLDTVMDGHCFLDREGRFLGASEAFCTLAGYSSVELLGMSLWDLSEPGKSAGTRDWLRQIEAGRAQRIEATLLRGDGRTVEVDVSASYLPTERRCLALVRDITDRKRAETLLRVQRDLAVEMAEASSIDEAMPQVLDACLETGAGDCGGVYLVDRRSGVLQLCCQRGLGAEFVAAAREFPPESAQARLVTQGEALFLAGAEVSQAFAACAGEGLRSLAAIPVVHEGRLVAAVNIGSRSADRMEPWVRDALSAISAQVAGTVARLRTQEALADGRRDLERQLEETRTVQQRLADIIEFLPDATFVIDREKRVIAWNRAIEEMTGTRKAEILGEGDFAYAVPFYGDRRPIVIDLIGAEDPVSATQYDYVRREGRTLVAETHVPSVFDGRGADVWATATALLDPDGNQIGAIESVRDVTEQRRAHDALTITEEKYRNIFENAIEGIFQVAPDGKMVTANPALASILGYRSAEDAVRGCSSLADGLYADAEARQDLATRLEAEGSVTGFETRLRRSDGGTVWVSMSVRAMVSPSEGTILYEGFLKDISKRKVAEEALRAEKAFSDVIIDRIPGTFFVISEDGRFVRWNRVQADATGWSDEELRVLDPLAIIHEDDREVAGDAIRQVFSSGASRIDVRVVTKDGRVVPYLLSGGRVTIDGANYVVGIGIDVTERKRAEEDLRRSEERFSRMFRSSPAASSVTTLATGHLLDANESLLRLLGHQREEFVGYTVTEKGVWDSPGDRDRLAQVLRSEGSVRDWECRFRAKDGHLVITRYSAELIDLAGEQCILSLLVDVTAQKAAEEQHARLQAEIAAAAAEWRATFDAVKTALVLADPDGTVRRCNDAARALAGKAWSAVVGASIVDLGAGEPWRSAAVLARQAIETGRSAAEQVHSSELSRSWSIEAACFGQRHDSVIVTLHDLTTVLALQSSLRQQETMAAMGSLLGGVAHEVRNPLFAISGLLDALDAKFDLDERMAPYMAALRKETDRMAGVMRALLEYGRPVSHDRSPSGIGTVLREATQLCQKEAEGRGVRLSADVAEGLPPVPMDHARMLEACRNLVENGIQHTPPGGTVLVVARPSRTRDTWLEVEVRDSGTGFAVEDCARVFEPFFSRRTGGTGLGLSIVQRVVTAHGGVVSAENHPDGGGLVRMEIPTR